MFILQLLYPSTIGWLAALFVIFIVAYVVEGKKKPYEEDPIGGLIMIEAIIVLLMTYLFAETSDAAHKHGAVYVFYSSFISAIQALPILGVALYRSKAVRTFVQWIIRRAGKWANDLTSRLANSDKFVLRRVSKRIRQLCAIIPDDLQLRFSFENIVSDTLPALLKRRREMQHAVSRIGALITGSERIPLTEFSQVHLQKVVAHKRTAEEELEKTQKEIMALIDSLELFEADLLMANASGDSAPVTRQLSELQERIASIAAGNEDIQRYLDVHPDRAK